MKLILQLPILLLFLFPVLLPAQCEWMTHGGSEKPDMSAAGAVVTTDAAGNIYLAGNYKDVFKIQGQTATNLYAGQEGAVLCKFNPNGILQWMKKLDSPSLKASDLHFRAGNLYFSGNYASWVTINGQNFSGMGENGIILKFDGNGNLVWGRTFNSTSTAYAYDLAFIDDNNFLFTGRFRQNVTIDGQQYLGSNANRNFGFYGRMTIHGQLQWFKMSGEEGNFCQPSTIAVAPNGEFYLGGGYRQGLAFGSIIAPNPGSTLATLPWIAKFTSGGDPLWLKTGTVPAGSGSLANMVNDLIVLPTNQVILSANIDAAVSFFGRTTGGKSTALLMRINSSGTLASDMELRSTLAGMAFRFARRDGLGRIWAGGTANGSLTILQNGAITNSGPVAQGFDKMLVQFSNAGAYSGLQLLPGTGNEELQDGVIHQNQYLVTTGKFAGTFQWAGSSGTSPNAATSNLSLLKICNFSPTTSTEDWHGNSMDMKLYPNPVVDDLFVELPEHHQASRYRIVDMTGSVLQEGIWPAGQKTISVAMLESGTYVLQIDHPLGLGSGIFLKK